MPPKKLALGGPPKPKQTVARQQAHAQEAAVAANALVQAFERLEAERRRGYGYRVPRGLDPLFESWELERRFPVNQRMGRGPQANVPVVPMEHFIIQRRGADGRYETVDVVTSKAVAAVRARETAVSGRVRPRRTGAESRKRARVDEEDEKIEKRNATSQRKPPKGK